MWSKVKNFLQYGSGDLEDESHDCQYIYVDSSEYSSDDDYTFYKSSKNGTAGQQDDESEASFYPPQDPQIEESIAEEQEEGTDNKQEVCEEKEIDVMKVEVEKVGEEEEDVVEAEEAKENNRQTKRKRVEESLDKSPVQKKTKRQEALPKNGVQGIKISTVFGSKRDMYDSIRQYEMALPKRKKDYIYMTFSDAVTFFCKDVDFKNYDREQIKAMKTQFQTIGKNLCEGYAKSRYYRDPEISHNITRYEDMVAGRADKLKFLQPIAVFSASVAFFSHNKSLIESMRNSIDCLKQYNDEIQTINQLPEKLFTQ